MERRFSQTLIRSMGLSSTLNGWGDSSVFSHHRPSINNPGKRLTAPLRAGSMIIAHYCHTRAWHAGNCRKIALQPFGSSPFRRSIWCLNGPPRQLTSGSDDVQVPPASEACQPGGTRPISGVYTPPGFCGPDKPNTGLIRVCGQPFFNQYKPHQGRPT